MDFRGACSDLTRQIEQRSDLNVLDSWIGEPVEEDVLGEAIRISGGKLPCEMQSFYRQVNGFKLRWKAEGDGGPNGSIDLLPLEDVYGDWYEILWFDDVPQGERFKGVCPVDFFAEDACVALYPGHSPDACLYYHICGESLHPLAIDFNSYFELLLLSRGLEQWPASLCASQIPGPRASQVVELFPDVPASKFRRRTDQISIEPRVPKRHEFISKPGGLLEGYGYWELVVESHPGLSPIQALKVARTVSDVPLLQLRVRLEQLPAVIRSPEKSWVVKRLIAELSSRGLVASAKRVS